LIYHPPGWIRTAQKKSRSAFHLAQYPFLLSLGAKVKVLVHDSKRQQNEQAGTSYVGLDGRRTVQPFITIRIRRERLIEDSLAQISSSLDHLKRALRIEFAGEVRPASGSASGSLAKVADRAFEPQEGVDAGGLKKEWFLLLCRDLFGTFGIGTGMWVQDEESHLCWFHPASFETDEQYTLVGVVVGLAVSWPTVNAACDMPAS
jgi:E3 ubiquitin-protein ligase HECTD2